MTSHLRKIVELAIIDVNRSQSQSLVITRYTLLLPIFKLIWGVLGLWKTHEGLLGPQTNIFYFECVVLVVIYLFHAS
jgi:hypothetical protein